MLETTRLVFSATCNITIFADSEGRVLLNNFSQRHLQKGDFSLWLAKQLEEKRQNEALHLNQIFTGDWISKLFLGKLTCMNLMVFHHLLEQPDTSDSLLSSVSARTRQLLTELSTLITEFAGESVQELIKRTINHGPQLVLKFLNSKKTGARDALDLDQRFQDIVGICINVLEL